MSEVGAPASPAINMLFFGLKMDLHQWVGFFTGAQMVRETTQGMDGCLPNYSPSEIIIGSTVLGSMDGLSSKTTQLVSTSEENSMGE
jgi:hypothetical protein